MTALYDCLGMRFGRLLVVGRSNRKWDCVCDCGATSSVPGCRLWSGNTKSCGCAKADALAKRNVKHGFSKRGQMASEYRIWKNIIGRTTNPNNPAWPRYGGRGITIAPEWRRDFATFLEYVGSRPSPAHTIDRVDNDKGYEPGNVRWASRGTQNRNTSKNTRHMFRGQSLCLAELARIAGLDHKTISYRLKRGWSVEDAVTMPPLGHR